MGVELRILSVISFPKLRKTDLFAATFRLKSLKLLRGTICPLRTTETVLQKKAPLRILGKKSEVQTGSNAMNILIRLSEIFAATTKHLTNVRLLWPLQTISQLQPYKKGHLGHSFHQLWNWSHLWLVSTTDLKAPLLTSLEHDTHWTWSRKTSQKRLQPHRWVVSQLRNI